MTRNIRYLAALLVFASGLHAFAQDAATPPAAAPPAAAQPAAAPPKEALKDAYANFFKIGVALNTQQYTERDAAAVAVIKNQFNSVAPENIMKWESIHPRPGADGYSFEGADAYVEFGVKNNMYIVGHTLLWHSQTPGWVFETGSPLLAPATPPATEVAPATPATPATPAAQPTPPAAEGAATPPAAAAGQAQPGDPARRGRGRGGRGGAGFGGGRGGRRGPSGPLATREELLERMRDHIHTVVGRYKGKIHAWDVVNEAIEDNGEEMLRRTYWTRLIGPDFIAKAFEFAHEADPNAILRYNDYSLENPNKRRKAIKMVKQLLDQGVPVHAIGTQAHLPVNNATFERMDETLRDLATLGLPIHVTELDINTAQGGQRNTGADISQNAAATQGGQVSEAERRLAEAYAGTFRAFIKHKEHVKLVTFWGLNDAVSWRRDGSPLLFNGQNQPKAAYDAVIAEVKKAQ
jgi:endo-1,4-beta-xylanase